MLSAILAAIANATALFDHLWQTFNNSDAVQAKVNQMNQSEQDDYNATVQLAMHGTPEQKKAALDKIRKLVSQ